MKFTVSFLLGINKNVTMNEFECKNGLAIPSSIFFKLYQWSISSVEKNLVEIGNF